LGAPVGWEAAVFDHFKAMVNTIGGKLRNSRCAPEMSDRVGGSTWSFDIRHGHPLEDEVYGTLRRLRAMLTDLRIRVDQTNGESTRLEDGTRVVVYVGQCVIGEEHEAEAEAVD
jgi:hypothetical protein